MAEDLWYKDEPKKSSAANTAPSPPTRDLWYDDPSKGGSNESAPEIPLHPGSTIPKRLQADSSFDLDGSLPGMISIPGKSLQNAANSITKFGQPGIDPKAGAVHEILGEAGKLISPLAIPVAAATAGPLATAAGIGMGLLGQAGGEKVLSAMGAGPGVSSLGGDIAGVAAGYAGPKISEALMQQAAKLPAGVKDFFKVDPIIAAIRAWSPTPTESGFQDRVEETGAIIKKANGSVPIKTNEQAVKATQDAIDSHGKMYDSWLDHGRKIGATVNGDDVVAATRNTIPDVLKRENPALAAEIVQEAEDAYGGKKLSVDEADNIRQQKTAQLKSLYNGTDGAQISKALAGGDDAIVKAQKEAIQNGLYNAIDPHNSGAGPRNIQLQRSDMIDILDAAKRRRNAATGSKPVSKFAGMVDLIPNTIKAVLNPQGGVGFVKNPTLANPGTIFDGSVDPWVKKFFNAVGEPKSLPAKPNPFSIPKISPKGLLGPATGGPQVVPSGKPIITPTSHVDPSGPMQQSYPVGSGNNRLLGSGPNVRVTPSPADASGPTTGEPARSPGFWNPKFAFKQKSLNPGSSVPQEVGLGSRVGDHLDMIPVNTPSGTQYMSRKAVELMQRFKEQSQR